MSKKVDAPRERPPEPPRRPLKNGLPPSHPGALLRTIILPDLKSKGLGKSKVAEALGISRRTLEDLVLERQGVTAEMALRLARYMRGSAEFWLNLQRTYDLKIAASRIAHELKAIKPLSREIINS